MVVRGGEGLNTGIFCCRPSLHSCLVLTYSHGVATGDVALTPTDHAVIIAFAAH